MFKRTLRKLVKALFDKNVNGNLFCIEDPEKGNVNVVYYLGESKGGTITLENEDNKWPLVAYNIEDQYRNTPDSNVYIEIVNYDEFEPSLLTHSSLFTDLLDSLIS